jgi:hypothetical protein
MTLKAAYNFDEKAHRKKGSIVGALTCEACWIAAEVVDSLWANNWV